MDQLTKGKNSDVSRVGLSAPKVLDNGAKLVYVNYNGGRFCVQTPWMTMPWAMSCFSEGPYPKYSAELSFKGMDDSGKDALELQQFHDKLIELEGKIVDAGVENDWNRMDLAGQVSAAGPAEGRDAIFVERSCAKLSASASCAALRP